MKTDTQEQAIAKATQHRQLTPVYPTIGIWSADGTQLTFFTRGGEIWCSAVLYREDTGAEAGVQVLTTKTTQEFRLSDALPLELFQAAQVIQAYLHNAACEQAGIS